MHDELLSALDSINPVGLTYSEWASVGMALNEAGCDWQVWDAWSQRDPARYHRGECEKKWIRFRGSSHPVTQATIFKMAHDRGWAGSPGGAIDWGDAITADSAVITSNSAVIRAARPAPAVPAAPVCTVPDVEPLPVEIPEEWDPAAQLIGYLKALFRPEEYVGYVVESWQRGSAYLPKKGSYGRTAAQLIGALETCGGDIGAVLGDYDPEAGAWIRFNPLDGQGCKDANVMDFRHALVESDAIPVERQHALIRQINLPCAALVYSGGKSLHAIVRVDAPGYEEYRRRVAFLYDVCRRNGLEPDTQCANPSRLSRLPGAVRGGQKQYLLATNTGAESWQAWCTGLGARTDSPPAAEPDDLPATENMADVWNAMPPLAPPLIGGVLRQGHKLLLAGPSKAGKSYALIELCIAIAEGVPWLGRFDCARGRVLYINLELDRASCLHRFADVYGALGLPPGGLSHIDVWNLRGASVPMDRLAPRLIRRAREKGYIAIVIDPIYKVITGDENSADQMARFCNQFDLVCRELGSAVIYCHHHSKGYQGQKRSMDRASGSGVFARDPDALLDLIELTPTDAIREQMAVRAVCGVCKRALDAKGLSDAYGPDDTFSKARMLAVCKEHLSAADMRVLDADIAAACAKAAKQTAWRIEGTLREFERFEAVNLWFEHPIHRLDDGLLEDLVPDADARATGRAGAARRWGKQTAEQRKAGNATALENAYEACTIDGKVTVYAMAQYMDLKPDTVKKRLRADGRFWVDGQEVGLKEPGSNG